MEDIDYSPAQHNPEHFLWPCEKKTSDTLFQPKNPKKRLKPLSLCGAECSTHPALPCPAADRGRTQPGLAGRAAAAALPSAAAETAVAAVVAGPTAAMGRASLPSGWGGGNGFVGFECGGASRI